jgi:hypothetical protein
MCRLTFVSTREEDLVPDAAGHLHACRGKCAHVEGCVPVSRNYPGILERVAQPVEIRSLFRPKPDKTGVHEVIGRLRA